MKLIIELSEERYNSIMRKAKYVCVSGMDYIIANGTSLSEELAEIREEIKALDEGITSYDYDDPWIYKREALEVIDKHISGEGE